MCDPRIIMNSPHACPVFTVGPLQTVLSDYGYWIGVPIIALGAYLSFVGGRYTGITLFLFTTLAVALIQLFAVYIFVLPGFTPVWTVPIIFIITLGMGAGLGYGAIQWQGIGMMVMGFSLGSLLGFGVYYFFLQSVVDTRTAKGITVLGVAIASMVLFMTLYDYMVITVSAIFGSYILIRVSKVGCFVRWAEPSKLHSRSGRDV